MRNSSFKFGSLNENEATKFSKRELPKIFKIMCSQFQKLDTEIDLIDNESQLPIKSEYSKNESSSMCQQLFMLAESEEEAKKWIIALTDLKNLIDHQNLPNKNVFNVKEVCDATAKLNLNSAQCATVIDKFKFVVGFADRGLMCVELEKGVSFRGF